MVLLLAIPSPSLWQADIERKALRPKSMLGQGLYVAIADNRLNIYSDILPYCFFCVFLHFQTVEQYGNTFKPNPQYGRERDSGHDRKGPRA